MLSLEMRKDQAISSLFKKGSQQISLADISCVISSWFLVTSRSNEKNMNVEVKPNSYLWGILGQETSCSLIWPPFVSRICFRCLIFNLSYFTNADVVTIKNETSKEILWNRCRSYWLPLVSRIFLDVSSLIFFLFYKCWCCND